MGMTALFFAAIGGLAIGWALTLRRDLRNCTACWEAAMRDAGHWEREARENYACWAERAAEREARRAAKRGALKAARDELGRPV